MVGGLVVLTAGGALAVSRARDPRDHPPVGVPKGVLDNEELPLADVPGPTDRPVEVVYCAGWDAAARAPVSPMAESVARAQDAAGAQWAAVLLAGMTGRVTVRPGPSAVPARFPWRPPSPLRPRHVTEMVTEGTRFRKPDGTAVTVERVDAGTVRLPSGRLVVADPGWLDADSVPLADRVAPGTWPVDVFQVAGMAVAARVSVAGAAVTSWHLALLEGVHELDLGDGEFRGNPVDTATIALVDATGVRAYSQAEIEKAMDGIADQAAFRTISDEKTGTDAVIVPGWTDGAYPVWLGRAADGATSCVVVDFMSPEPADAQPV